MIADKLEQRGYEAGKTDALETITDDIKQRITSARKMATWDSWSRGYVKGFDEHVR